jgi:hypothetical protein
MLELGGRQRCAGPRLTIKRANETPGGVRKVILLMTGISLLYLVVTIFLHREVKLKQDSTQPGFDDKALLDVSREKAQLRGKKDSVIPSQPQSRSSYVSLEHREETTGLPKTLFKEGTGVSAFNFYSETVKERKPAANEYENSHDTEDKAVGRARHVKKGEETSKFGLPLTTSRARKNLAAQMKPKSAQNSTKSKQNGKSHSRDNNQLHDRETIADVWSRGLLHKLACLRRGGGGVFLYHVRKAAGTSIRDVLEQACKRWHVSLFETEGLSLDAAFLSYGGSSGRAQGAGALLSVTTLREPVQRAISMYWYEHVGWWDGIQKKTEKCHTLADWVATWRDSSEWKRNFMRKNPRSVYVEIENYYVKMLTGWTGEHVDGPLGETHLLKAKRALDSFDVVLLTEWMEDATQIDALNALFPGRSTIATKHMLRGDKKAKERLQSTLAPDEDDIKLELATINALDMALWEYAQSLVARRLRDIPALVKQAAAMTAVKTPAQCGTRVRGLPQALTQQLGIHQPPGHKAPL